MVGVIIPVWKAKDVLPHALDSLVAQTKRMFLVCISIDGDDEDYSEIIEEYKRRGLKICVIRQEVNGGPGMARQAGIFKMAPMCDYLMFLDADDMLMPQAVDKLYEEAKKTNADAIQSSIIAASRVDPDRVLAAASTPVTWTHGKIYRSKYLLDNKIEFIPEIRLNEDSYFNVVAMNCTKNKYTVDMVTYYWNDNPNSLTRRDSKEFFKISWEQYVLSQIRGMKKIEEATPEHLTGVLFAMTTINIFWHHAEARQLKLDDTKAIEYFSEWKDIPKFQMLFDSEIFWKTIAANLKASMIKGDDIIFPKQNFAEWINTYFKRS